MRFKAVIFDLDDTLYDEFDFISGGYKTIASYLSEKYDHSKKLILERMLDRYKNRGRDKLFDYILKESSIKKGNNIKKLVDIYRRHKPSIKLYKDAILTINQLRSMKIKLGLITDGIKIVQKTKVKNLGLDKFMDKIIYTDDFRSNKLSPKPFRLVTEFLKVEYVDSCYVGDDPFKDFFWPNKLKMASIRINRGRFKNVINKKRAYKAKFTISCLEEIFLL